MVKAGDVLFIKGDSIISKLVMFFDKGNFSHVAIAVSETHILEANWNMRSRIRKLKYKDYTVMSLNLTKQQRKFISDNAAKYEGATYDYLQILGLLVKHSLDNPRKYICSELVYLVLRDAKYFERTQYRDLTPNELYRILQVKEGT